MIDKGCALEGPAMRSSEAATGTRSRMPACSTSTTTGPTIATTTSASADPSIQRLDDGTPSGGSFLVERIPEETPKARHADVQPGTAAGPTGAVVERGNVNFSTGEIQCISSNSSSKSASWQAMNPAKLSAEPNISMPNLHISCGTNLAMAVLSKIGGLKTPWQKSDSEYSYQVVEGHL